MGSIVCKKGQAYLVEIMCRTGEGEKIGAEFVT